MDTKIKKKEVGNMFSQQVSSFLSNDPVGVPSFNGSKCYSVRLGTNEVELLDRPNLRPIPLRVFDIVEDCLNRHIHRPGCDHSHLGDDDLDERTIMYYVATEGFGQEIGRSIIANSCYIFAILNAAGCINRRRGYIEKK